jgi:hypothetical protein
MHLSVAFERGTKMDAVQSDVEREAREFMEENEALLEDGGLQTVQRVFVQGAQISQTLSAKAVEQQKTQDALDQARDCMDDGGLFDFDWAQCS